MSFFASSLYFFITHSYFEQTRKKTLLSSNVWFLTHNKSRVIFIYPADNWLFIYIRVRRMDWSWLTVAWTKRKKRASTILRLIRFNCEARDLWLNCALQTLLPYWWNLLFFLINQKKKNWQQQQMFIPLTHPSFALPSFSVLYNCINFETATTVFQIRNCPLLMCLPLASIKIFICIYCRWKKKLFLQMLSDVLPSSSDDGK
jgi:hypothetical protein